MSEIIKSCPFCGGEGKICATPWDFENNKPFDNHRYVIECSNCLASTDEFETREKAIDAWNERIKELTEIHNCTSCSKRYYGKGWYCWSGNKSTLNHCHNGDPDKDRSLYNSFSGQWKTERELEEEQQ